MVYAPIKRSVYAPSTFYGPHNVFIDSGSALPWYFHRNYSSFYKYSHFYGGTWHFPQSNYPLHALYKSPWLDRPYPYHNIGNEREWYY